MRISCLAHRRDASTAPELGWLTGESLNRRRQRVHLESAPGRTAPEGEAYTRRLTPSGPKQQGSSMENRGIRTPARRHRPGSRYRHLAVSAALMDEQLGSEVRRKRTADNPFAHYGKITLKVW